MLIVGCGGLGCPAAQYLAASGIGRAAALHVHATYMCYSTVADITALSVAPCYIAPPINGDIACIQPKAAVWIHTPRPVVWILCDVFI